MLIPDTDGFILITGLHHPPTAANFSVLERDKFTQFRVLLYTGAENLNETANINTEYARMASKKQRWPFKLCCSQSRAWNEKLKSAGFSFTGCVEWRQ